RALLVRSKDIIEDSERGPHHRFRADLIRYSQPGLISPVVRRGTAGTHIGRAARDRVLVIEEVLTGVVIKGAEAGQHPHGSHVVPAQTEIERPLRAGPESVLHIPGVCVEKEGPVRRSADAIYAEWQTQYKARQSVASAGAESRLGWTEILSSMGLVR